jgi:Ca-activated chloride channel homolog
MKFGAAVFIFLMPHLTFALTPGVIRKNNEAVKQMESEKNFEAYRSLTDGLAEAPFQEELHLNLGFAFEKNQEKDKALAEYLGIAKNSTNPAFKFQALFNAARLKGEMKKVDEALALYQQALEIDPESKEVKTNMELLIASGGGGGGGDDKDKDKEKKDGDKGEEKDKKDGEGDENKDKQKPQGPQPKSSPKPFDSKELNKQDVKNILDELKRQENQIRAKEFEKKGKEQKGGKDW